MYKDRRLAVLDLGCDDLQVNHGRTDRTGIESIIKRRETEQNRDPTQRGIISLEGPNGPLVLRLLDTDLSLDIPVAIKAAAVEDDWGPDAYVAIRINGFLSRALDERQQTKAVA